MTTYSENFKTLRDGTNNAVQGVILDIDGTLLDSNDAHAKSWEKVLNDEGFKVSFADIRPLIGMGGDKLLPKLTGIRADSNRGQRIGKQRVQLFKVGYMPQLKPFKSAKELLETLRARGLKMAVATSASRQEMNELLKIIDVQHLMDGKATSTDAAHSKPDADIVLAAIDELNLKPENVVMLGDTPYDIEAARRSHVKTIAFRCGGWGDDDLRDANEIYDNAADLLLHLDQSLLFKGRTQAA